MENFFSKKMAIKSDNELIDIISNKESFDDQAILAATWELDKRKLSTENTSTIKNELTEKIKKHNHEKNNTLPIPKVAIFLVALLLSPLFGAILLSINLFQRKNKKAIIIVFGFAILYTILSILIFNITAYHFTAVIIINALGSAIISEYFWKIYIERKATQNS